MDDNKIGRLTNTNGEVYIYYTDTKRNSVIEIKRIPDNNLRNKYILQDRSDLVNPGNFVCGFEDLPIDETELILENRSSDYTAPENGFCINIIIDIDHQTYLSLNEDIEDDYIMVIKFIFTIENHLFRSMGWTY